ncbi:uncharacterized protein LOC116849216 isoform X1 [Odontomachus brunneus]|uniref:uncharacterized protein LOC116849216 isoform X1 n=1 Tax=Odontomachus brunneus TaxID=486640 RepID=UPI0013F18384|nr:uncharacterized protein LOC116849216 isoform X1 [Odontomachus brunneus]
MVQFELFSVTVTGVADSTEIRLDTVRLNREYNDWLDLVIYQIDLCIDWLCPIVLCSIETFPADSRNSVVAMFSLKRVSTSSQWSASQIFCEFNPPECRYISEMALVYQAHKARGLY